MALAPLSPLAPLGAAATVTATPPLSAAAPDASSVAAFERALSGPPAATPERELAGAMQRLALATRSPLGQGPVTDSPERMLAVQSALHRSLLDVEVTARVAGSLGQAINKLVSLQ